MVRPGSRGNPQAGPWLVAQHPIETDECVEWPFARTTGGYGAVYWEGKVRKAHHVSLLLAGREPADPKARPRQETRHLCNNPPCVNPRHLLVGTVRENQMDRVEAGTSNRGERNGRGKLTADDVLSIRRRYERGNGLALAAEFGIAPKTLYRIVAGGSWAWLKETA